MLKTIIFGIHLEGRSSSTWWIDCMCKVREGEKTRIILWSLWYKQQDEWRCSYEIGKRGGKIYLKGRGTENCLNLSSLICLLDIQDQILSIVGYSPQKNVNSKRIVTFVCFVHCCIFRTWKRHIINVQYIFIEWLSK